MANFSTRTEALHALILRQDNPPRSERPPEEAPQQPGNLYAFSRRASDGQQGDIVDITLAQTLRPIVQGIGRRVVAVYALSGTRDADTRPQSPEEIAYDLAIVDRPLFSDEDQSEATRIAAAMGRDPADARALELLGRNLSNDRIGLPSLVIPPVVYIPIQ